jgi:hypothetical protein
MARVTFSGLLTLETIGSWIQLPLATGANSSASAQGTFYSRLGTVITFRTTLITISVFLLEKFNSSCYLALLVRLSSALRIFFISFTLALVFVLGIVRSDILHGDLLLNRFLGGLTDTIITGGGAGT